MRKSTIGAPILVVVLFGLAGALIARPVGAEEAAKLSFADLYKSMGVLGLQFSEKIKGLSHKPIAMRGYMAPPLKPEADFFVMTKEPVSLCPFCQSDADWPADIVVVHLQKGSALTSNTEPIEVTGVLEVGPQTDPQTGFVSLLRIVEARVRRL